MSPGKSTEFIEKTPMVKGLIMEMIGDSFPLIANRLEVIISPFGSGAKFVLMKSINKSIVPIAVACDSTLSGHPKEIAKVIWDGLRNRAAPELQYLRVECEKLRRIFKK